MTPQISAFLLSVHRASRHMAHDEFAPWLFREIGAHVRCDSGLWLRLVLPDAGPQILETYLDRQRPDRITAYIEQELWREDPLMTDACITRPYRARTLSAAALPAGRLRDFLELHEQRHAVCAFDFEPVTRSFTGFGVFRRGHDDGFSEAERESVEFVEPHLRDAWNHNWLREIGASRPGPLHSEFSQALLRSDHVVAASDELFSVMIHREWPQWQGPAVPAPWIDHLQAHRDPWVGQSIVAYFEGMQGGMTLLRLRARHRFDQLAPRKREVALAFAAGTSQGEVALDLGLSVSTVNNYLVEIYRELEVSDKAGLAKLAARLEP